MFSFDAVYKMPWSDSEYEFAYFERDPSLRFVFVERRLVKSIWYYQYEVVADNMPIIRIYTDVELNYPDISDDVCFEYFVSYDTIRKPTIPLSLFIRNAWTPCRGVITWMRDDLGNEAPFDFYTFGYFTLPEVPFTSIIPKEKMVSLLKYGLPLMYALNSEQVINALATPDRCSYRNIRYESICPFFVNNVHDLRIRESRGFVDSGFCINIDNSYVKLSKSSNSQFFNFKMLNPAGDIYAGESTVLGDNTLTKAVKNLSFENDFFLQKGDSVKSFNGVKLTEFHGNSTDFSYHVKNSCIVRLEFVMRQVEGEAPLPHFFSVILNGKTAKAIPVMPFSFDAMVYSVNTIVKANAGDLIKIDTGGFSEYIEYSEVCEM